MNVKARKYAEELVALAPDILRCGAGCLPLAQSGHSDLLNQCPLLGVKRTSEEGASMSAFGPKRKSERFARHA
jgi:hypothetical protein